MGRYLARMTKDRKIKFISHLDYMRSIQRAIRRAGLPISYSKGFNPHANLSFATPLAVGVASESEYMDFTLDIDMDPDLIMQKLADFLPPGIKVVRVMEVDQKLPSLMSLVTAASYEITVVNINLNRLSGKDIDDFFDLPQLEITKESKSGKRLVDIRPLIYSISLKSKINDEAKIESLIAAGSSNNLNPELLFNAMVQNIPSLHDGMIRDITKKDTYAGKAGDFKTLMEIM